MTETRPVLAESRSWVYPHGCTLPGYTLLLTYPRCTCYPGTPRPQRGVQGPPAMERVPIGYPSSPPARTSIYIELIGN